MSAYWFRPKQYGYGAVPVTWEGWAVLAAAVAAIVAAAVLVLGRYAPSPWAWLAFFLIEALILVGLWPIVRRKTEGEWRWRWGDR
jgi:hypothetical protein